MTADGQAGYAKAYEVLRVAKKHHTAMGKPVDHDFAELPDPDDFDYST